MSRGPRPGEFPARPEHPTDSVCLPISPRRTPPGGRGRVARSQSRPGARRWRRFARLEILLGHPSRGVGGGSGRSPRPTSPRVRRPAWPASSCIDSSPTGCWFGALARESAQRLQNVARLFDILRGAVTVLRDPRLPFLVARLDTLITAGDDPATADGRRGARPSTPDVPQGKGSEFRSFMVGCPDRPPLARGDPVEPRGAVHEASATATTTSPRSAIVLRGRARPVRPSS
jgi:hypothetical protein